MCRGLKRERQLLENKYLNQNLGPPLRLKVDKTRKHLHVEIRNHVYQLQLVEPHTFLNLQAQTAAPNNAYQF